MILTKQDADFQVLQQVRNTPVRKQNKGTLDLVFHANPQQLRVLYHNGAVMLSGHPRRLTIQHAILQVGEREAKRIAGISAAVKDQLPGAEDCKTSQLSGKTWRHVAAACSSFAPLKPRIQADWV